MKDKVDAILVQLPDDANPPIVIKHDISAIPIMELMVTGNSPLHELYELVDREIKEPLSRIQGVAGVDILGGEKREIQVNLSKDA